MLARRLAVAVSLALTAFAACGDTGTPAAPIGSGTGVDGAAADAASGDASAKADGNGDAAADAAGDADAVADAANDVGNAASDSATDTGAADGTVDAGCPLGTPGADSDGDGAEDVDDCMPCDPQVYPGATAWHSTPRSDGLWDWNCDGVEERQYPSKGKCVYPGCTLQQGFYSVPPCGGKGELIAYCITQQYSCGTQYQSSNSSTQHCR